MADIPGTLTGVGALLVAVLGAIGPAAAAGGLVVTGPSAPVTPVGTSTTIGGASVAGFGPGTLRLVITVSSGVLGLPATTPDVTTPAGYPELGATGPQLAIEGDESAVNIALAGLSWVPAAPGPAEVTLDVAPAGAAYEPEGARFYQLIRSQAPISWDAARDAAASMTFQDLPGSLAQITTDAEQALLTRIASVDAWVGAADMGAPSGVRWPSSPDASASIAHYIVEYTDPLVEGGPIVGRAISSLRAARPPSAPVIDDVSAGVGNATVHWQHPTADGGAPVLGYLVSGEPAGWCAVPATQTFCVLRGLAGGTAHTFQVAAITEVGLSAWSEPSASVVPSIRSSDTVDTTVQPAPTVAPVADPDPTTPPAPEADATEPPPASEDAGSPPPAIAPATAAVTAPVTELETPAVDPSATPVPAADAAADDAQTATAGSPALTIVFDVGPGASLADATFTVRGKHLSPGTIVQVIAHSEPVVLGIADIAADGTLRWAGHLPADLTDGDHELIAGAVGHDGSYVERTMAFTTESGRLVRIGASSLETIGPTVPATTPTAEAATDAAIAAPDESSGGGIPRRAIAVLVLLGAAAILWWRARSRRSADSNATLAVSPATTDNGASARPARAAAPGGSGGATRRRQRASTADRRRSRRQPARPG